MSLPEAADLATSPRLEVACAVEGDYVPHSAAMLHSLLANRGSCEVRIHYMHGPDFPAEAARRLEEMVVRDGGEISFLAVDDERCAGLPTRGFTGKATWYRIFLPELLADVDRVISLDLDAIVTDSLAPLWTTDLGGSPVAAVTNVLDGGYIDRPAALGIEPAQYFNAGVMLFDLELMRSEGLSEQLRRFGVEHADELILRDQDALNAVLAHDRHPLHPRWNCMNALFVFPWAAYVFSAEELAEARDRPAIRHFEGPSVNKPWHFDCGHDLRELYAANRRHTPWPDVELEGATARKRLRRRLGQARRRLRPS